MTLHTKQRTTDAMNSGDASATDKNLAGAAAASHVDECTSGDVFMLCPIPDGDRQTVTRAELISALEAAREANDLVHRLKRRIFWGLAWRRTLIVVLLLLYAFELWRQAQVDV